MSGVKIFMASQPQDAKSQEDLLKRINQAYADFVSKNPFQEPEMPIKSPAFDNQIQAIFSMS